MQWWHYIEQHIQHYIHSSIHLIHLHPRFGLLFAFLISFAESLPLLGSVIPGSVTMTAVGTLIGAGILPPYLTLFCAVMGAFAGDFIGFYLGYRYHKTIHKIWFFKKYPLLLNKGEAFFEKHGGKGVVIGRFVGPLRSAIPLVAGILRMRPVRFIIAAVPSAVLWALAYTVPGIILGALSTDLPKGEATKFMVSGVIIIAALWAVVWLIKHILRKSYRFYRQQMHPIWLKQKKQQSLLFRLTHNPSAPEQDLPMRLFISACTSLILFLLLWASLAFSNIWQHLNQNTWLLLQSFRHDTWQHIALAISLLGDKATIIVVATIFAGYLAWEKQWHAFYILCLNVISIVCLLAALKLGFHSLRPSGIAKQATSNSFPSGHTALTVTIYGMIAAIICFQRSIICKITGSAIVTVLTIAVAFTRMYLGMHWLTDVIAGIWLGYAILNLTHIALIRKQHPTLNMNKSLLCISVAIIISWLSTYHLFFNKRLEQSKLVTAKQSILWSDWWDSKNSILPTYRTNRIGKEVSPFNIQWASTMPQISALLKEHGWQNKTRLGALQRLFNRLTKINPESHLPMLPLLYLNKKPQLFMIKPSQAKNTPILELRLWDSGTSFKDSKTPLWIGSVQYHMPPHKLLAIRPSERSSYATKDAVEQIAQWLGTEHIPWKKIHPKEIKTHNSKRTRASREYPGYILLIPAKTPS